MEEVNDKNHLTFCKNHPQVVSRYFITEQPWIRYCKECALNVALCGRNIAQDYSGGEFQRKMQILSVVNQLRRNSQQADDNNRSYQKIISMLQDGAKPLSEHITQIDKSIKDLTSIRDNLHSILEKQMVGKVNQFLQRQSKMALTCRQVKSQLQTIQSNFSHLIDLPTQIYQEKIASWSDLIQTSKKQQMTQQEISDNKHKIFSVMQTFYNQIDKLSTFSLNLETRREIIANSDTFQMVLTPIDSNSLCASSSIQGSSFKKSKKELKLRSNKKLNTDRDVTTRKQSKRGSVSRIEPHYLSQICKIIT